MLLTTRGIVLHSVKYSETSIVVRIYTEARGLQAFLFRGIRSPKSKIKAGLFQPLTLLELVTNIRENKGLHSCRDVRLCQPYSEIPFDIRKSSVALYMNELLYKSVKEEEQNPRLFKFLWEACRILDEMKDNLSMFPLVFTVRLTEFLGIIPARGYSAGRQVFNIRESRFQQSIPEQGEYILPEHGKAFDDILSCDLEMSSNLRLKPAARRYLLDSMLIYYQVHLPGFRPLNSHHVLHSVLA
jgi:DNA repair protein RecO (recombination protein O)